MQGIVLMALGINWGVYYMITLSFILIVSNHLVKIDQYLNKA